MLKLRMRWRRSVTALLVHLLVLSAPLQAHQVLVIHSYGVGFKWTRDMDAAIRDHFLREETAVTSIFSEFLDSKYHNSEDYFAMAADYMRQQYEGWQIDAIIVTDNLALHWANLYRDSTFGEIPLVFAGINGYEPELHENLRMVTGVAEEIDIYANILLIQKLFPDGRTLHLIGNGSHTFFRNLNTAQDALSRVTLDRNVMIHRRLLNSRIPDLAEGAEPGDAVLMLEVTLDAPGVASDYRRSGRLLSAGAGMPVFGLWDFLMDTGVAGGLLTSGRRQGLAAAELVERVLAGEDADTIAVMTDSPNEWEFDLAALKPFGIRGRDLPEGSRLINTDVNILDRYALEISIGITAILALTALSVALGLILGQRNVVMHQLRDALSEKDTLIKEIHHRVKNNLQVVSSILNMQSSILEDDTTRAYFLDCESRVQSMALVHEQLYQSRNLQSIVAVDYVNELVVSVTRLMERPDMPVRIIQEVEELYLDLDHAIPLGLLVTEVLSNSIKYAYPGSGGPIIVRLTQKADRAELSIADEGVGLTSDVEKGASLGLQLIKALAEQLEGQVCFHDRSPGLEVVVCFRLPFTVPKNVHLKQDSSMRDSRL